MFTVPKEQVKYVSEHYGYAKSPNMYVCKLKITFSHLFEKVMPKCTARKTKRAFYNISNLKLHSIAMFG